MFYIICYLAENVQSGTTQMMLSTGIFVMIVFSLLFLFYTNSFLMKRRKKEFGLYSVLGMEKNTSQGLCFLKTYMST